MSGTSYVWIVNQIGAYGPPVFISDTKYQLAWWAKAQKLKHTLDYYACWRIRVRDGKTALVDLKELAGD